MPDHPHSFAGCSRIAALVRAILITVLALCASISVAASASAHGFTSVVFADITSAGSGTARVELQLEYDLLVVSAADAENDDALFREGTAAFEDEDAAAQSAALEAHADTVLHYVADRFTVSADGTACTPARAGEITMTVQEGVPYAVFVLHEQCPPTSDGHVVTSTLFADEEGYVTGTKTLVTYALDLQSGSAALEAAHPSFSTQQSVLERFWEFFTLGAEHLLTGIDHILFLLALIAGSRRLREIVLAATAFTLAHSVTFILAATGLVSAPAAIVEPVIALSIAIVAAWYLWRIWRRGAAATELDTRTGTLGLDRAGWLRLGVVFLFGLVHGLGFASALGIDEPWSWTLLWSLLVFNLGIEAVQIGIILLVFPVLALLRHRAPRAELWVTGLLALGVTAVGLFWFVQRVLSL
ncbi:HupE/UreJ family protein [Microbacterium protaetiae]|uniref:HupE/UreJ family protein n=1 Tax=Microbacterium protaetiae TaxID=2509458 RepID=A0A4P6EAI9_9MICO|nr:HupE/UreJ family protein [Microbacterium protaetiae]QAY58984.1 HupE/UreJ family protein [Microbacterium protaetiae]